jgi:hypothetical protein
MHTRMHTHTHTHTRTPPTHTHMPSPTDSWCRYTKINVFVNDEALTTVAFDNPPKGQEAVTPTDGQVGPKPIGFRVYIYCYG